MVMTGHLGHPVPPGWSQLKRSQSITERAMGVSRLKSSVKRHPELTP